MYIPYAIGGLLGVLVSIMFGTFLFLGHSYDTMEAELVKCPNTAGMKSKTLLTDQGNKKFYVTFLIFICFLYILVAWRDYTYNLYIFSMAVTSEIQMDQQTAGILNTTYNAVMGLGRIVYAVLTTILPVQHLLFSQCVISIALSILMVLMGLSGPLQFWVLTCLLGFFASPNVPTLLAWANRYIVCNGLACAVVAIGMGVGGMIGTWVNGVVLQNYGAWKMLVFSLGLMLAILVLLLPMQLYANRRGERYLKSAPSIEVQPTAEHENTYLLLKQKL